ncbi:MAG: beta-galactosidase, partial [Ginsengibacter sp.]
MKKKFILATIIAISSMLTFAQLPLPEIRQNGAVKQMFVNGKPFIMLAGELHNSSASSIEYMKPVWDNMAAMHLNTVVSAVSWELLEPEEGKFNFDLVDSQIDEARKRKIRLVIIWFASWKNGGSNYVPMWVKTNPQRFPVQVSKPVTSGKGSMFRESDRTMPLSPLGEASMNAEAKAFRVLMHHIKEVDHQHTVIMMQVDNEMGLLADSRDRSKLADAAWLKPVPAQLMNYFTKNKATLLPEMQEVWGRNGFKFTGTWAEVFGSDEWAEEVFMAWHYSVYINKVIVEGKAELNIPMYVNAWLGPQPGAVLPGEWPSGGPVARVMDVWHAGAPANDLLAPDIYVPDFKEVLAEYSRSGNPLWIPEARDEVGNLFWAIGHHAALGWA